MGSGGMTSKLQAAEIAERAGIALAIVNGTHDAPLARALREGTGTLFLPAPGRCSAQGVARRAAAAEGRADRRSGRGARAGRRAAACSRRGSIAVEGRFARGDAVAVRDRAGALLAQGLAEYDAEECATLMGRHSREHEALLGYAPRSAVIHRDQLVVL